MAQNITLLGASYSDVPAVELPKTGGGTAMFTDVTPTSATASDVASGKIFFASDGTQTTGTASGGGGGAYAWFGNGAEKVATVINKTINLSADTSYDSWTASTTATTIKAASSTDDYTLSNASGDYDYCFLTRWFCQPVYLAGTTLKSTAYRFCAYNANAIFGYPDKSTISAMQSGTPIGTTVNSYDNISSNSCSCYYYYNNGGNLVCYSTPYGPMYTTGNPTFTMSASSGNITASFKLPAINARCNASRFATSMKTQVDSANTNMYITTELIRCPRGNGFGSAVFEMLRADLNA